jgi:uracil-DNA glycosylase family 4
MSENLVAAYLRAQMEMGTPEVFFEEPLVLEPARSVVPDARSVAPPTQGFAKSTPSFESKDSYKPANKPVVDPAPAAAADLSLLIPMAAPSLPSTEDLARIESATSLESFHEAVMHHPFYRLGPNSPGRIAFGVGPVRPSLMLVGFAPSEEDLKTSGFFSGAPSELLRKLLESLSFSRNLCYATWLVKKPVASAPLPRQLAVLRKILQVEANLIKPELILFLGEPCFHAAMALNTPLQNIGGSAMEFAGYKATAIFDPRQMHENPALKSITWKQHLPKSGFFRQNGL